jgi:hypothetical protein
MLQNYSSNPQLDGPHNRSKHSGEAITITFASYQSISLKSSVFRKCLCSNCHKHVFRFCSELEPLMTRKGFVTKPQSSCQHYNCTTAVQTEQRHEGYSNETRSWT